MKPTLLHGYRLRNVSGWQSSGGHQVHNSILCATLTNWKLCFRKRRNWSLFLTCQTLQVPSPTLERYRILSMVILMYFLLSLFFLSFSSFFVPLLFTHSITYKGVWSDRHYANEYLSFIIKFSLFLGNGLRWRCCFCTAQSSRRQSSRCRFLRGINPHTTFIYLLTHYLLPARDSHGIKSTDRTWHSSTHPQGSIHTSAP